ncbi:unnamed protein product [Timema podura]|uniref:Uncharacterized protein n=1 Tax=Timema podura TaxID=61482 RepID=A0ABN7PEX7_TIMPD|nr:unnamed protein product [Timema podura]
MIRLTFVCVILISCSFQSKTAKTLRDEYKRHQPRSLNADQILKLSALSNVTQFQSVLNTVIQPRVVGTKGHERVKQAMDIIPKTMARIIFVSRAVESVRQDLDSFIN